MFCRTFRLQHHRACWECPLSLSRSRWRSSITNIINAENFSSRNSLSMLTIRIATIADAALLRRLIWELADYEKEPDQVQTTEADIARDGFGANPQFRAVIAEWQGQP